MCIVFDTGIQNYSRISHWVRRAVVYLDGYNFQKTNGKQERGGVVAQFKAQVTKSLLKAL